MGQIPRSTERNLVLVIKLPIHSSSGCGGNGSSTAAALVQRRQFSSTARTCRAEAWLRRTTPGE